MTTEDRKKNLFLLCAALLIIAFSPLLAGTVLVATVAICVVAALPPALRAVAGDPSDALSGR